MLLSYQGMAKFLMIITFLSDLFSIFLKNIHELERGKGKGKYRNRNCVFFLNSLSLQLYKRFIIVEHNVKFSPISLESFASKMRGFSPLLMIDD